MSTELLILPTFNRYFPQVVSQSPSGIIAYGCRNIIYFIDAQCYPPVVLDSKCIYKAYREKVAGLSFCKIENIELIASISDCGEVKIWDISTGSVLNSLIVTEGVNNIEWIHGSPNTVVFTQNCKALMKWNFSANKSTSIKLGAELKTCFITSNEKCPHLLAVGHNNGTITVLDIVQEKILQRFKDHSREINILTWSPILPDTLLSVSSDFSARSWKMGEEKSIKLFWIGKAKPEDRRKFRVLGTYHPKKPDVMICSNAYGDVGEVTLSEEKPRFKPYSKTAEVSCRSLFALFSGALKTGNPVDILYCFDNYMFSTWNITEKKLISFIPFFMGFVYDLSFSPVNPIYMSISNGDGIVRIWNAQADSLSSQMASVFVQGKTKIMTAAWHPIFENILAFGTDAGKLGIVDTIKKRHQYPFETFHKGTVYCICWGPCKVSSIEDSKDDEYFIYSCGGGDILVNRYKKLNEPAQNFFALATRPEDIEPVETTCSELSWKYDYSCVCIGTYKGFIEVYDDKLVFVTRCDLEMKCIESLKWHPESTYMSPSGSLLKCWLACSGVDTTIYILDTSKIFEEKSENSADWIVKKLTGHKKSINCICWSPHRDEYMVSASKDGSALVWNVCTGNIIVSYLGHSDVVNTVHWSIFDEDVIYSGGQDNCVRIWRISQQKNVAPADRAPKRKKLRRPKPLSSELEKVQDSGDEGVPGMENSTLQNENTYDENFETNMNGNKPFEIVKTEETSENALSANEKKTQSELEYRKNQAFYVTVNSKKTMVLFDAQHSTKEDDLKNIMELADILCKGTQGSDENFDPLKPIEGNLSDDDAFKFGLYTDQITALRMADVQAEKFKSRKDTNRFSQLSIMTNNVQKLIQDAVDNGTLTNYLVSLAPSVSYSFWLEICEKYAIQLMQEQQPYIACTYFLMCNKIYEAIDVLKDKGRVIDALALARLRLPESDPVIPKLLHLLRKRFKCSPDSLGEIKCYLSLNEPLCAIKTLGSIPDASCVKAAAYICIKYNMNDELEKYKFIFMQRCLIECDWESFRQFVNQETSLQVYSILFAVHEAFYVHLRYLKKQSGIFLKEIFSLPNSEEFVKFWNGTTCIDSDKSFIEHICDVLASRNLLPTEESALETIIQSLDIFSSKWNVLESSSDAHVAIAVYITKFILLTSMGDTASATTNFLKILESSCNITFLPKIIFMLFFPIKLLWNQNLKSIICQSKTCDLEGSRNMVVTQYQHIVQCISEKIMSKAFSFDLTVVSKDGLQKNLRSVTEKIATVLSKKEFEEFVLAYFVTYIVYDLSRLIDKKVIPLECHAEKLNSSLEKKADEIVQPDKMVDELPDKTINEIPSENNLTDVNSENDKMEIQKEESPDLESLIDAALKEADDKMRTLSIVQTSMACEDTSNNSTKIKDMPDLCSNEVYGNDENICKNETNLTIDNEERKNVSDGECYVEICSSSYVGDSVVQVASSNAISHAHCIASIDLFCHLISFIMSNICKEEFVILYYLKEHVKFLHHQRASHELSKISKTNFNKSKLGKNTSEKAALQKVKVPKSKTDIFTVTENDKSVADVQNTEAETSQIETLKDSDEKTGYNNSSVASANCPQNDSKNEISNSSIESVGHITLQSTVAETRQIELKDGDGNVISNTKQNDDDKDFSDSVPESTNQLQSDNHELKTIISTDHNYSSPLKDFDPLQATIDPLNKMNVDSNLDVDDSLLKEMSELIHLLESKTEGISYPNPLDIVSKVLRILHDVRQNSTCRIIQEKLHMLIDDIVHWAETFQVANVKFVCEICQ